MAKEKPVKVKELIEFLNTCKPNAKIYYTLGGSSNCAPVTYYEVDDYGIELGKSKKGGVIIGECTW